MFKKLVFKLLVAAGVMFGLSSYVGYLYTGQLPPFLSGLRGYLPKPHAPGDKGAGNWTDIGSLQGKTTIDEDGYQRIESGKTVIYKWKDEKGHWHFDERKPSASVKFEQQEVAKPNTSESIPAPAVQAATESTAATEPPALANPYSREGVQEIMQKAKEAQKLMNDHNRRTEQY